MKKVSNLFIHPVKSCQILEVKQVSLDTFGIQGDRRWLIVDEKGLPITQRDTPKLATIIASVITTDSIQLSSKNSVPCLAKMDETEGKRIETQIWGTPCTAIDCGDSIADWLHAFLDKPARLLAMGSSFSRHVKKHPKEQVSFADAYPVLIASTASLDFLNTKLDTVIPMSRFRPNIVVSGCSAFEEDAWKRIRIGDATFEAAGYSTRCSMTTVDQSSGLRVGKEPLATLTKLRKDISKKPIFGQNYINVSKTGSIKTGMPVQIIE